MFEKILLFYSGDLNDISLSQLKFAQCKSICIIKMMHKRKPCTMSRSMESYKVGRKFMEKF